MNSAGDTSYPIENPQCTIIVDICVYILVNIAKLLHICMYILNYGLHIIVYYHFLFNSKSQLEINTFVLQFCLYWGYSIFVQFISPHLPCTQLFKTSSNYNPSIINTISVVLRNQLSIPLCVKFVEPYLHMNNMTFSENFMNYVCILFVCLTSTSITFYYIHRTLHVSYLYKNIHSIHHQWKAPHGFCALYAHMFEFIFCNLLSFMSGPLILSYFSISIPINFYYFWVVIATINTVNAHSPIKYFIPTWSKLGTNDFLTYNMHYAHHLFVINNYGVISNILDKFHDTYKVRYA
jgi:sterol desaturase/sphingolipid hydroxylase (fatty acid hydroxylase superfamily)